MHLFKQEMGFMGIKNLVLLVCATAVVVGCGKKSDTEEAPAPNTGNKVFESEKAPESEQPANNEQNVAMPNNSVLRSAPDTKTYYVYTNQLNVRSTPENNSTNIVGRLVLNDEVRVLEVIPNSTFAQIEILQTHEKMNASEKYFVAREYLSEKKNVSKAQEPRSRYFMIQNVATEKLRVYEKGCDQGSCAHKMILEADIAVGEKTKDRERMTVLGYFHITDWIKFYQDGAGTYPSWFDPALPMPPAPHAGVLSWTSKRLMPANGAGKVRGAFGWYTALVGPNPHNQWTHGTLGWGADKDKYIRATRGFWANLFTDPRSHGCSRTDNETIAYVRHLLPVGTPLMKVYAIEELSDSTLSRYPEKTKNWDYIMTKRGVRVANGEEADRDYVMAKNVAKTDWLEEGTYTVHLLPSIKKFRAGSSGAKSGKNGNLYGLDNSEMHGKLLVDEGLLVNYSHPASLQVGGYGRDSLPAFATSGADIVKP